MNESRCIKPLLNLVGLIQWACQVRASHRRTRGIGDVERQSALQGQNRIYLPSAQHSLFESVEVVANHFAATERKFDQRTQDEAVPHIQVGVATLLLPVEVVEVILLVVGKTVQRSGRIVKSKRAGDPERADPWNFSPDVNARRPCHRL